MTKVIIAVDGPAASGKGSIARRLAAEFGLAHLDTGALYRIVAYHLLEEGFTAEDEAEAFRIADTLAHKLEPELYDSPLIRTEEVSQTTSKISAFPRVRAALKALQVDFAENPPQNRAGSVLDGRDIGSVICPDAPAKLFITASVEERARRRAKELQGRGENVIEEAVLTALKERDARDAGRANAPTRAAPDAFTLDTTTLDLEASYAAARAYVLSRLPGLA